MSPPNNYAPLPHYSRSNQLSSDSPSSSVLNLTNSTPLTSNPSSPPSPSLTKPFTLLSFPDDIIRRILTHLLSPTLRGTPYYPPYPPAPLLPLSMVCTTMRRHVSRLLASDNSWVASRPSSCVLDSSAENDQFLEDYFSAWYRLAGSQLRHFTYGSIKRVRFEAIVSVVADLRPRLTKLDLSGVEQAVLTEKMEQAVSAILRNGRQSIKELHVSAGSGVASLVARAGMCGVTVLGMKYTGTGEKEVLLELMRNFKRLEDVTIWIVEPLPGAREEEVRAVTGTVKVLRIREWRGCIQKGIVWQGWVRWVRGMADLKELILKDVVIEGDLLRDVVGGAEKVELVNCTVTKFDLCLNKAVMSKVTRFEVGRMLSWKDIRALQDFGEGFVTMELKIDINGVKVLGDLLERQDKLEELTLYVCGNETGRSAEAALVDALMRATGALRKLVIVRQSLPVAGAVKIMTKLKGSLEYMVVGLNSGMGSLSLAIIRMLRGVVRQCKKIRILCFGMFLPTDIRARELNPELLRAIEEVGKVCEGLDTVWLRRNAKRLLEVPNLMTSR